MNVMPIKQIRKQAKAQLPTPTASFEGKTVIITGANGAFGAGAAQIIADHEVDTLILACRDIVKGEAVKKIIEETTKTEPKSQILVWRLDLASFDSVREFAQKAKGLESLDAVILNAGMFSAKKEVTPEGWEMTIQVNYLATILLTLLLIPTMKASPSNPQGVPIISFVASWSAFLANFTMKPPETGPYLKHLCSNKDGREQQQQYSRSKLLCMYFLRDLATRVPANRIIINFVDPGAAWTRLTGGNKESMLHRFFMRISERPVETCAKTLVNAVLQTDKTHGKLLVDYDVVKWPKFMTKKEGVRRQQKIWEETRGIFEGYAPEVAAVYATFDAPETPTEK